MINIFDIIRKTDYNGAFDAYCDNFEILIADSRKPLEDECLQYSKVSKRAVKMAHEENIFRLKKHVEKMREAWGCGENIAFYILPNPYLVARRRNA